MATQTYVDGVTLTAASEFNKFDTVAYAVLSGAAGTNTVTATGPANYSYSAATPPVWIIPANTNTGATTVNVTLSGASALGAKNLFWNGAACVGGELRQNIPAAIIYDGTQFHIIANGFNAPFLDTHAIVEGSGDSTKKVRIEADGITTATTRVWTAPDRDVNIGVTLGTEQASTSGTSIDFTGIPAGVRRITVHFVGLSTNGTSPLLVQIGDSGGIETTGYVTFAGRETSSNSTAGFIIHSALVAAATWHGKCILSMEDSTDNTWTGIGFLGAAGEAHNTSGGSKATSAVLDRVRVTTAAGADTFDAGVINISYEF